MREKLKKVLKVQSVNNIFYLLICFIIISCSSKKALINTNQIDVLKEIITSANYNIYYKTIINDLDKPINDYINNDIEFLFCDNEFIKPEEINYLKNKKVKVINLYQIPLKSKDKITRKKNSYNAYISIPILFRNNTMALYYSTQRYGGNFMLLQKKKSKWVTLCSSQVWIE